jgi:hypothetical protein
MKRTLLNFGGATVAAGEFRAIGGAEGMPEA